LLWFSMKQHWRIVKDDSMSSARKRREMGKEPLEDGDTIPKQDAMSPKGLNIT